MNWDNVTRITDYDYGLGLALESEGPNFKCDDYNSNNRVGDCPEAERTYATKKTVVDAHGRAIEEWLSYDQQYNQNPYSLRKVKELYYDDWAYRVSGLPISVTEKNWLRNSEWATKTTTLDVFGRTLSSELEKHRKR